MSEPSEPELGELAPGAKVGDFVVTGKLGAGGMGTVYAGEEPRIHKRVAIKVMKHAFARDPQQVARFLREAQAVNQIGHPGIVDVFAFGTLDDGRPYLVMSRLEGRSLRDELRARGRFAPDEAWAIARETAEALTAAHARGIVHRDLKPDNVLLEHSGSKVRVRVLDFGLAKMEAKPGDVALSQSGAPMGTPLYMAPEQWWAQGIDARTDQYALGAMLFELLAGRPPFVSETYVQLLQQHLHEPPPTLKSVGVELPEGVEALVAKMLAKAPAARFESLDAVIAEGDAQLGAPGVVRLTSKEASVAAEGTAPTLPSGERDALASAATAVAPASAQPARASESLSLQRGPWLRFSALHLAWMVLGFGALVVMGYAGERPHDPVWWFRLSGYTAFPSTGLALLAAIALPFLAWRRARTGTGDTLAATLALLPSLFIGLGEHTAWEAVNRTLDRVGIADRLSIAYAGAYEANAIRFQAFAQSALLLVSICVLPAVAPLDPRRTLSRALGLRGTESLIGAALMAGLGVLALALGAPSAAWVALVGLAVLGFAAALPLRRADDALGDELWRTTFGLLAVALAATVGFSRLEGLEGVVWTGELARAARAAEILARADERSLTTGLILAAFFIVGGAEGLRIARLRRVSALPRPGVRGIALAVLALAVVASDVLFYARMRDTKDHAAAAIAPQLALFARLDPPGGDALDIQNTPHAAPALQLTREAVAVQGDRVALVSALGSEAGQGAVANALCPAVAGAEPETGAPQLSVIVDRSVPMSVLARCLRIARACGAESLEVLLTRGPAPHLPRRAPPEAASVIPSDFFALRARVADDGESLEGERPFGEVVPGWIEAARGGKVVRLSVGR